MKDNEKKIIADTIKQTSHHDVFFKEFYSNPQFALELFQLIFSSEEMKAYDWAELKIEKDTFKGKRADLVYSVPLKGNNKIRLKIFILLEHKSAYDRQLFTQLLNYQVFIHEQTVQGTKQASPVIPVLFYHGKAPWKWKLSFQETFFGDFLPEIPVLSRESMLNYKLRLLDANAPKVESVFKDTKFKSRGALYLLREVWSLKAELSEVEKVIKLLKDFEGKQDELIVSAADYLLRAVPGMNRELWETAEKRAVARGLLQKGGYMNVTERLKEEGRQEGRQEGWQKGRQEVILKMLKEKADIAFISKVTGLSEKAIRKLKSNS